MSKAEDDEHTCASELKTLQELRREVLDKLPDNSLLRLQSLLERALAEEDYERAAELRDELARHQGGDS
jgi:protein-arginine kinase activator protein McsA